jgi:hypothetical protein
MALSRFWQSQTALMLSVGLVSTATLPFVANRAIAGSLPPDGQLMAQSWDDYIPAGTQIPVELEDAERIVVAPDETLNVSLIVSDDVRSRQGDVVIPYGSEIRGRMEPVSGGTQFVAESIVLNDEDGDRLPFEAESNIFTQTEVIDRRSDPDILRGAVIGAAAGAVLSEIFGRIDLWEVLGGAGLGVLTEVATRGDEEAEVFVIEPENELRLTLEDDFER